MWQLYCMLALWKKSSLQLYHMNIFWHFYVWRCHTQPIDQMIPIIPWGNHELSIIAPHLTTRIFHPQYLLHFWCCLINEACFYFLKISPKRDRIIAGKSQRHGNLNFTCCGAMRQPRYRLQIVFLGSRETRQPRYKNLNPGYPRHFLQPGYKTTAIQKLIYN